MGFENSFFPGMASIPAAALKEVARAASRTEAAEAPPGAPLAPPEVDALEILPAFVIARTVNEPAALSAHGYTIRVEGNNYPVPWSDLWTIMPFGLVDPEANKNARFMPAAVVGDAVHAQSPHRAQGLLIRMPGTVNNKSTAMVWLWGLSPAFGCETG